MEITPEELKVKLDRGEKIRIIDVREPEEYAICHLKEVKLIPMGQIQKRLDELNPRDFTVLYCHHGTRSFQAALWLRQKGFQNAWNLQGGIDAWAERIDHRMARY